MQIYVHIFRVVHAKLPACNDNNTIFDACDMNWSGNMATDDEGSLNVFENETGERAT